MLQIDVIMVGKTREAFIQEGLAFYEKRRFVPRPEDAPGMQFAA